jgi:rSAM/selenodomain-associated transferase 1
MTPTAARRERICLFTRYPEAGTTKTRLIPALGPAGAADLQRRMTRHILKEARQAARLRPAVVEIRYAGGGRRKMRQWLGADLRYQAQASGDIGQRMARAAQDAAADGCPAVIIIGSDIPGITAAVVVGAFERLATNDLVIGPAIDGGYYLIGLRLPPPGQAVPALFTDIAWGTATVRADTLARAASLNLRPILLTPLNDVDRPEDLVHWQKIDKTSPAP